VEVVSPPTAARLDQRQISRLQPRDCCALESPTLKKRITAAEEQSLANSKKLRVAAASTVTAASSAPSHNKFSIASYNVWFGPPDGGAAGQVYPKERMAAVVDRLQAAAIAQRDCPLLFVGLQELTTSLVEYIGPHFKKLGYRLCTQPLESSAGGASYGVGIAVRTDLMILERRFVPFGNSLQGRGMMYVRTRTLLLATTHLESYCGPQYTGASEREKQVVEATRFCQGLLDRNDSTLQLAVIAGDLNWDDERKQKRGDGPQNQNLVSLLSPRWYDAGSPFDYTYDSKLNPMLSGSLRRRLDRCIYCCTSKRKAGYRSASFQKVGNEVIPNLAWDKKNTYNGSTKKMPVTASDHFGIVVSFRSQS
jgi:Endonuclease/Exonuclease/phosphatase family